MTNLEKVNDLINEVTDIIKDDAFHDNSREGQLKRYAQQLIGLDAEIKTLKARRNDLETRIASGTKEISRIEGELMGSVGANVTHRVITYNKLAVFVQYNNGKPSVTICDVLSA